MARRSYDQYCPAARALDLVGDRWTMLIVRDLLLGPQRYTDLLEGLPGIGPNVLAERLRHLQTHGLAQQRTLPPPAASTVYELTEVGEELRPIIQALTRWGLHFLGAPREEDRFRLSWLVRALEATFRPDAARGVSESYEFRVDGEVFHADIDDHRVAVRQGPARNAAFTFATDLATFIAVGARRLSAQDALASGRATFDGDVEAGERSIEILGPHLGSLSGPGGLLATARTRLRPEAAGGRRESYEFRVDGEIFHIQLDGAEAAITPGPAKRPHVSITTDLGTLLALSIGQLGSRQATEEGLITVNGNSEAADRAWAVLAIASPSTADQ